MNEKLEAQIREKFKSLSEDDKKAINYKAATNAQYTRKALENIVKFVDKDKKYTSSDLIPFLVGVGSGIIKLLGELSEVQEKTNSSFTKLEAKKVEFALKELRRVLTESEQKNNRNLF